MNGYKIAKASSLFRGVNWNKKNRKWKAYIRPNGHQVHLGFFDSEKDAALAYNQKANELYGEYALLNDI